MKKRITDETRQSKLAVMREYLSLDRDALPSFVTLAASYVYSTATRMPVTVYQEHLRRKLMVDVQSKDTYF